MTHPVQICPLVGISDNKSIYNKVFNIIPATVSLPKGITVNPNENKIFLISMKEFLAIKKLEMETYDVSGIFVSKELLINLN